MTIQERKLQHINIVLEKDVEPVSSSFETIQLPYRSMPECDLDAISTQTDFLNHTVAFPLMVASMTGGEEKGAIINRNLAIAAQEMKIPLALGSMRVTLRKPESLKSFAIRHLCPDIPLLANMGLIQLNYGYGADEINRILDSIDADGICLHINPLQEAVQPEGDTHRAGLLDACAKVFPKVNKPIIIKEVGNGMDAYTIQAFRDLGVAGIDVNGMGGTSRPLVEGYRRKDRLGATIAQIGYTTVESLRIAHPLLHESNTSLIAGGGIRSGVDVVKACMLGADCVSVAKPFLQAALTSPDALIELLRIRKQEIRIAMFACGVRDVEELKKMTST